MRRSPVRSGTSVGPAGGGRTRVSAHRCADVYTISIAPAAAHLRATRHSEAIEKVRALARGLEVDGWFTYNHTHYARVASFRER